jgi:hypothetical protein
VIASPGLFSPRAAAVRWLGSENLLNSHRTRNWQLDSRGAGTFDVESASPQEGEGGMRIIVALLALLVSDAAMAQQRTYQDSMGRNIGRSVIDARGNTTFYDAMGRNTGRSATDSRGNTTYYDSMGRNTGRSVTRGNITTVYDSFGRQTGRIRSGP